MSQEIMMINLKASFTAMAVSRNPSPIKDGVALSVLIFLLSASTLSAQPSAVEQNCFDLERAGKNLIVDPPNDLTLVRSKLDHAIDACSRASRHVKEPSAKADLLTRVALLRQTRLLFTDGNHRDEIVEALEQAIQLVSDTCGEHCPALVPLYGNLSGYFQNAGNYEEGRQLLMNALKIGSLHYGESSYRLANTYLLLAGSFATEGADPLEIERFGKDSEKADEYFLKAVDLVLKDESTPPKDVEQIVGAYKGHLHRTGRSEEAFALDELLLSERPGGDSY